MTITMVSVMTVSVISVMTIAVEWIFVTVGIRIVSISITQVSRFRNCHTDCNGQQQNDIL